VVGALRAPTPPSRHALALFKCVEAFRLHSWPKANAIPLP